MKELWLVLLFTVFFECYKSWTFAYQPAAFSVLQEVTRVGDGGPGRNPPRMCSSLFFWPETHLSLWSLCALAGASKLRLAHGCSLLYSWDRHPGKPCPLISPFWSPHFLFCSTQPVEEAPKFHEIIQKIKNKIAGKWPSLCRVWDDNHTGSLNIFPVVSWILQPTFCSI